MSLQRNVNPEVVMSSIKPIHPLEALDRVSQSLGFDMQLDSETHCYQFTHVASGHRLLTTWTPPWKHDHTTKTITCQHGKSWGQTQAVACDRCLDPEVQKSEELVFAQTALTVAEEMWAVTTTGKPRPLVS